jgi:hypothetical protein
MLGKIFFSFLEFDRVQYINYGKEYDIKIPYDIEYLPELNENYKNIFRLFYWKNIGKTKLEIQKILQVNKKFIEKYWNTQPSDLHPPRSVSPYVRAYELSLLELYFEPFKPVQIIRYIIFFFFFQISPFFLPISIVRKGGYYYLFFSI